MKDNKEKTNVMRLLDRVKLTYQVHTYLNTKAVSGPEVAAILHQNPERLFKTLVTAGKTGRYYVFMIPVNRELDLKKAATAVDEKTVAMIKSRELLEITGYVHGGCSPLGMKKTFPTAIHQSAGSCETILFSAGKIGYQIEMKPADLINYIHADSRDLIVSA